MNGTVLNVFKVAATCATVHFTRFNYLEVASAKVNWSTLRLTLHFTLVVHNDAGVVLEVDVNTILPAESLALANNHGGHDLHRHNEKKKSINIASKNACDATAKQPRTKYRR